MHKPRQYIYPRQIPISLRARLEPDIARVAVESLLSGSRSTVARCDNAGVDAYTSARPAVKAQGSSRPGADLLGW